MSTVKKTMVAALAFVTENGNMSADNLQAFTEQFCYKADDAVSKPREIVKLFDNTGEVLGRRCSITLKWLDIKEFFKDGSMSKAADKVKAKLYTESKVMEKKAQELLDSARELTDPTEKLAAFEGYDVAMVEAKTHRLQDISGDVEFEDGVETFESIQELAEALGVEVITAKPAVEKPAEDDTESDTEVEV